VLSPIRVGCALITPPEGADTYTVSEEPDGDRSAAYLFRCDVLTLGRYVVVNLSALVSTINVPIAAGVTHRWRSKTGGPTSFSVHVDFGTVNVVPPGEDVPASGNSTNTPAVIGKVKGLVTPSRYDVNGLFKPA
jgi:hypothetical protein